MAGHSGHAAILVTSSLGTSVGEPIVENAHHTRRASTPNRGSRYLNTRIRRRAMTGVANTKAANGHAAPIKVVALSPNHPRDRVIHNRTTCPRIQLDLIVPVITYYRRAMRRGLFLVRIRICRCTSCMTAAWNLGNHTFSANAVASFEPATSPIPPRMRPPKTRHAGGASAHAATASRDPPMEPAAPPATPAHSVLRK